jgi:hypothetical protein
LPSLYIMAKEIVFVVGCTSVKKWCRYETS